jgi:hypothetical protein
MRSLGLFLLALRFQKVSRQSQQSVTLFEVARPHVSRHNFDGMIARKPTPLAITDTFPLVPTYKNIRNITSLEQTYFTK